MIDILYVDIPVTALSMISSLRFFAERYYPVNSYRYGHPWVFIATSATMLYFLYLC